MHPWQRLAVIVVAMAAIVLLCNLLSLPKGVDYVVNMAASVSWFLLEPWVVDRPPADSHGIPPQAQQLQMPADVSQSAIATVFYVAGVSIFSMMLMSIFASSLLLDLDKLEQAKLLHFEDLGYEEVQKYLVGTMFFAIWIPAATTLGVALGRSRRPIQLWAFLAGAAVSVPVYLVAANTLGLGVAFGDASQVYGALGTKPVHVANYDMLVWTALVIQMSASALLIVILSLYPWAWARFVRWLTARNWAR